MVVSYSFLLYFLFVLSLYVVNGKDLSDRDSSLDIRKGRALGPSLVTNGAMRQKQNLRDSTKQREMARIQAERANARPRRSVPDQSNTNANSGDVTVSPGWQRQHAPTLKTAMQPLMPHIPQHQGFTQKQGTIPNVVHVFSKRCGAQVKHQRQWNRMGFQVKCYSNEDQLAECEKVGLRFTMRHMNIQVSDICRFAVLYTYGGIYADLDVQPNPAYRGSLQDLVDPVYGTVIGFEANMVAPRDRAAFPTVLPRSVCMWVMGSQAHMQVLLDIAHKQLANIRPRHAGEGMDHYIHDTTGPTAITRFLDLKYKDLEFKSVTLFGCGQHHSSSGRCDSPTAFAKHNFHGSWREDTRVFPGNSAEVTPAKAAAGSFLRKRVSRESRRNVRA